MYCYIVIMLCVFKSEGAVKCVWYDLHLLRDLRVCPLSICQKNVTYNNIAFMRVCGELLRNKDTFFVTKPR